MTYVEKYGGINGILMNRYPSSSHYLADDWECHWWLSIDCRLLYSYMYSPSTGYSRDVTDLELLETEKHVSAFTSFNFNHNGLEWKLPMPSETWSFL